MTDDQTDGELPPDAIAPDGGSGSYRAVEREGGETEPVRDDGAFEPMTDDDREFLLEAVRRAPLLEYLGRAPASAADVVEGVEMSRSTVHRALDSLTDLGLIRKRGGAYELTNLGELLLAELERFGARARTARSLTPFLNSVGMDGTEIPVEHLSDATVIRREPRRPHATVHRIMELFDRAAEVRMFSTVVSPIYVDMAYPKMVDGMEIRAVFEREVVDLLLSEYPEKAHETMASGNFDVYARDGLPFELFVFEDRIGMAAHDDRGNAEVLIETGDPGAVAWAEDLYERYLSTATSVSVSDI